MDTKIDIIKRLKKNQSKRSIARELGISRKVVNKVAKLYISNGWINQENIPTEDEIRKYYKDNFKKESHTFDKIKDKIKDWYLSKYTFVVITKLINDELKTNYNEITTRLYIHDNFPKIPKAINRRKYKIGEILEVDFGYLGMMYDVEEKRKRKVWLFSMRFRYSRYAYRELVFSQKAEIFFNCHINAFEYFEGVPEKVVRFM